MAGELYEAIKNIVVDMLGPLKTGQQFNMSLALVISWNGQRGKAIIDGGGEVSFTSHSHLPIVIGKSVMIAPIMRGKGIPKSSDNLLYYAVGVL